jgi:hypothetical protein
MQLTMEPLGAMGQRVVQPIVNQHVACTCRTALDEQVKAASG